MTSRHTVIPAVYVIFKRDNSLLFLRRFNTGYADGMLTTVAGHVEEHEHYSQAAIREAAEEVGITLTQDQLKIFHIMHRTFDAAPDRVDVFFMVESWIGEPKNNEPAKCSELLWCDISILPNDVLPFLKAGLEQGFSGNFFSEL